MNWDEDAEHHEFNSSPLHGLVYAFVMQVIVIAVVAATWWLARMVWR